MNAWHDLSAIFITLDRSSGPFHIARMAGTAKPACKHKVIQSNRLFVKIETSRPHVPKSEPIRFPSTPKEQNTL